MDTRSPSPSPSRSSYLKRKKHTSTHFVSCSNTLLASDSTSCKHVNENDEKQSERLLRAAAAAAEAAAAARAETASRGALERCMPVPVSPRARAMKP